jgi:branched-chain amino acid transport system ATP-binding protein
MGDRVRAARFRVRQAKEILMLKLNNVEVMYNDVILVLRGVSLQLRPQKIIALLGANGAGKSTTLKAISGLLGIEIGEVTHGSIEFEGRRIDKLTPEAIVRRGIVQVLEGNRLFDHLTVEENLRASAYVNKAGTVKEDLVIVYNHFPRLGPLAHRTSGYLSGGEQKMLVIGSALMSHPKIMLLDEPSLGLAPLVAKEIFSIIVEINRDQHTSILLVEQNVRAALEIAEYAYIMEDGRTVLDGPSEKLKDNEDVKEFYLGLSQIGSRKSYREVKHYRRRKRWLS